MSLKLSPIQIQKQTLSPVMQQSIEVLLLPLGELDMAIENELQENPLLEVDEQKTELERRQMEMLVEQNFKRIMNDPMTASSNYESGEDDEKTEAKQITRLPSLEDYLLKQMRLEIADPEELKIGELILGNIDEAGYLSCSCEEIADVLGWEDVEPVAYILKIIQNFDPLGIGARNLKECLLIQASAYFPNDSLLIKKIINNHLEKLGSKRFTDIANKLKVSVDDIKLAAKKIATFEPRPARKFRQGPANIYVKPDVTVRKDDQDNFYVQINKENVPYLRISQVYQNMLKQGNRSEQEIEFIKEKIKNALTFIRSVEQRHQTVERIAQYILDYQKDFFKYGPSALKPMRLKDVAQVVDRNESTVSRAVNKKYIDTPQGLYSMRFFFGNAIVQDVENKESTVSSRSIKEEIKDLVEEENKIKPLSDQAIQEHFKKKGMKIARRTINKYRQALNILPAHMRKS
ncbi:RNA polymerase sigma-54 factor RpoN [hydrothermal vent metagenome]|uniref:RNA polymerase sigma-54 factor RpoN n=1 Tax=hydrothermal vent metagenome TaxID=652676 RepID=A0A3B1DMT0_9ZZZZ